MSDYVCEELIDEIFTRLPSKSLLRFRSLSKSCCSRIASPDFIRNHALRSPKKVLMEHLRFSDGITEKLYALHSEDQLPLNDLYMGITPLNVPCNDCHIMGSCNGLVCLFDRKIGTIALWNPSIRRKLTVPPHPSLKNSTPVFGFGFDPITYDYKIIAISCYWSSGRYVQESLIYTINTGTWRTIAFPSPTRFPYARRSCFVNGALHWIVTDLHNVGNCYIISFDLSTEVFGKVSLPEPNLEARNLMVINGCLAVLNGECHNPIIWVRRKHNDIESWSVLFKLEVLPCEESTTNGDLVVFTIYEGYKVYNLATGVRSPLVKFKDWWNGGIAVVDTYSESLALLNGGIACNGNQPASWFRSRKIKREKKTPGTWLMVLKYVIKYSHRIMTLTIAEMVGEIIWQHTAAYVRKAV